MDYCVHTTRKQNGHSYRGKPILIFLFRFYAHPYCDRPTGDQHLNHLDISRDEELPLTPKKRLCHSIPGLPSGWRGGLLLNTCLAILVLVTNVSFLTWVSDDSTFTIKCESTEKFSIITYSMVNILSTVLLGASNYTMQVLTSPKRPEVDKMHRQGKTLVIGVHSFENLCSIGTHRKLLWLLLAISSLPLHLL